MYATRIYERPWLILVLQFQTTYILKQIPGKCVYAYTYLTYAVNKVSKEEAGRANEELLPFGSLRERNSK